MKFEANALNDPKTTKTTTYSKAHQNCVLILNYSVTESQISLHLALWSVVFIGYFERSILNDPQITFNSTSSKVAQ